MKNARLQRRGRFIGGTTRLAWLGRRRDHEAEKSVAGDTKQPRSARPHAINACANNEAAREAAGKTLGTPQSLTPTLSFSFESEKREVAERPSQCVYQKPEAGRFAVSTATRT